MPKHIVILPEAIPCDTGAAAWSPSGNLSPLLLVGLFVSCSTGEDKVLADTLSGDFGSLSCTL